MKIPKYILHPGLLILAATGIYFLTKIPTPAASQPALFKKEILDQNHLYQIVDFTSDGSLVMENIPEKKQINDERFKNLPDDKQASARDFFVGKFVKVLDVQKNSLDLPIELYDPLCFSSNLAQRESSEQCPVILEK